MAEGDLTAPEFERLLDAEASGLEPDVRELLDVHGIPPVRMTYTWDWGAGPVATPIWVFARAGDEVLGYDEVEQAYGTGVGREGGTVGEWGTWGARLRRALLRFPAARRP